MGIYGALAQQPGVVRVLVSQLLARFPFGMLSIILLLHIQLAFGDFTSAGIVLAAQSIGQAISGPLSGRIMGRFGMRPVLASTSLICTALLVTIAFVHLPLATVAGIAFLIGVTTPPVTPAVRTLYPKLVPSKQLSALFSLDASAQEIIWVLGPVVAVFVSSQFGTTAGLCVAAGFMLLGGAWFIMSPAVGSVKLKPSKHRFGAVLRYPTVVISTVVGLFFVASMSAVEAGVVAAFAGDGHDGSGGHGSIESGIVLALFAGGSLVGGLLMGHREMRPWSLALRIGIVLAGMLAAMVSLNIWWLSIVLFLGGLGTAPAFAALSNIVASTVKFSETAEAYGWVGMGQLVGVAMGSALGGVAIDVMNARGAILVAALMLLTAALISLASVRWIPDLKGRTIEPPPETGTLSIPLN
ncbi:MFS transporter [Leucobacter tenebrionis]|uniref:MFS transporter n=1 Tax=Leucobacter tenebrionis TaxID=2873270 RepID=UPI001CA63565|nr:MFS transporter [Leucobacter tenebrionis]QZY51727.1 MFS transporter [Leucobacter tenebrionis]